MFIVIISLFLAIQKISCIQNLRVIRMAVGAYEAVWLFVGFDLPTLTNVDRKRASRFRNDLLDLGVRMFQLSFYSYYFTYKAQADTVASRIERLVPPNGSVSIFYITDKQFAMIRTFYGGKVKENEEPEQGLLFL